MLLPQVDAIHCELTHTLLYLPIYWQSYRADPHCGVADTFCQCRDGRSSITLPYNISNETFSYEQQVIFSSSTVQQAAVTFQWAMLAVRWCHFLFITARNKRWWSHIRVPQYSSGNLLILWLKGSLCYYWIWLCYAAVSTSFSSASTGHYCNPFHDYERWNSFDN